MPVAFLRYVDSDVLLKRLLNAPLCVYEVESMILCLHLGYVLKEEKNLAGARI